MALATYRVDGCIEMDDVRSQVVLAKDLQHSPGCVAKTSLGEAPQSTGNEMRLPSPFHQNLLHEDMEACGRALLKFSPSGWLQCILHGLKRGIGAAP